MSSKKEEKVAFERLKKAFPGDNSSLCCDYNSWRKELYYYCTVNNFGSTCGEDLKTADEAVDAIIKRKE